MHGSTKFTVLKTHFVLGFDEWCRVTVGRIYSSSHTKLSLIFLPSKVFSMQLFTSRHNIKNFARCCRLYFKYYIGNLNEGTLYGQTQFRVCSYRVWTFLCSLCAQCVQYFPMFWILKNCVFEVSFRYNHFYYWNKDLVDLLYFHF